MLNVQDLHKAFGQQVIFDGASLQMNAGDRYALMGPNGAGKSTLFRILRGTDTPDDGVISYPRGLKVGYLPQETADIGDGTVIEETLAAFHGDADPATAERRGAEAKKILMGLGFRVSDFDRAATALSGGWRMRIAIARLLLEDPDLLLLDEPTNHLDLDSLLWFQNKLLESKSTLLLISHDRAFVNAIAHGILDLRERKLNKYPGDYENFLAAREREEEQRLEAYKRQQREIADAQEFINRFRAQAAKAPQVQSRIKWIEKQVLIEIPPEIRKVKINFPQPEKPGVRVLSLQGIHKAYGDVKVYEGLDFELERGQKVALVGPNGAGKSTLLKILAGVLPFEKGERVLGLNVKAGYFSQHRWESLRPDRTVLQEAMDTRRMNPDLLVRTILGTFLFRDNAVFKQVAVLSGGEKSRLALAKLLLDPPNLLLLDEPTTHLDMSSVEALVDALRDFPGTLVFISHDLYFVNALATHVAHVDKGRARLYAGNHDDFLRQAAYAFSSSPADDTSPPKSPGQKGTEVSWVKGSAEDLRRLREAEKERSKRRKKINQKIRSLEEEIADLNGDLSSVFIQSDYKKLMELDQALKGREAELAEARAALAKEA
ncbi:MAG: ABC-F family ATP-binding cassette domain-containing protein [Elusimicrobia bacterium]|nr:ABC-F family ATP-binding cassette domain-containing protein [Elusimicrobiota bacterium]MBK7208039.1 ABC-F family ATP-binding cassette domain-containing protein [Elusimicrobiota bacterium]MBK7544817.1 ABC-F family ATP-binding cassette domain-containing protein [Elusimicrobiota bacterium]MBK7574329.1 ABC-F family ATP-binding cassette domain-containing protein [Elusimicrobiota bacterium]MBK7688307.1 ABC-F family ATP-binding cassette domain-containing protein [Elusimicrobiota bacterium]